jgi:hypothetical protein
MRLTLKEVHQMIKAADFLLGAAQRGELTEKEQAALQRFIEKIKRVLEG